MKSLELKVEKVLFCKDKKQIKKIYTSSFQKEERMPFLLMMIMSCLWNTEFLAFYDGEILCGMIYLATIGKQSFIMFFAVDKGQRSKGYGGIILSKIKAMHPKNKIIVSIEPCNKESTDIEFCKRRKRFYMHNGYKDTGYIMKLGGTVQEVLINGGEFKKSSFVRFFMLYSNLTLIPKIWKSENNI